VSTSIATTPKDAASKHTAVRRDRILALVLLGGVTLAAALLRFPQLGESLWVDELHTAWTAGGSLAEVAPRAGDGNQSPLYFYLVWGLARLLGMSEAVVRLPSLLAGVALVPAAYFVLLRWTASRAAALLTAVLTAVDPHCLFYSLEARPYALVQLAALLHVYAFSRLMLAERATSGVKGGVQPKGSRSLWPWRAAFVAGAAVLFHLHYTAALLLPAELLAYALAWPWRRRRLAYRPWMLLLDTALVVLTWLPACGHLLEIAARRKNWEAFITQGPISDTPFWFPLSYAVIWPGLILATAALVRWLFDRRPLVAPVPVALALLAACWEAVPALLAHAATQADVARLFHLRYLNVSVPAAPAIAGLLCGWSEGRFARLLQLLVIGSAAVYASDVVPSYLASEKFFIHNEENWRAAVEFVNRENRQRKQLVLVESNLIECSALGENRPRLRRYCLFPVTGIYRIEAAVLPAERDGGRLRLPALLAKDLQRESGLWLLVRAPPGRATAIQQAAREAVRAGGAPAEIGEKRQNFAGVTAFYLSWRPAGS
jgi:hypothetical protein